MVELVSVPCERARLRARAQACTCASIPWGPLIFPALLYERSGSERPADVEALTFLVAAARAGVKRHPAPQSGTSASARTGPRVHAPTSGPVLMNRLTTDHTRWRICSLPRRLQPSELQKCSKWTIKMGVVWPEWLRYTPQIGRSKQPY